MNHPPQSPQPKSPRAPLALLFGSIAASLAVGMASCSGPRATVSTEWQAGAIWRAPAKLNGCAVGDLKPGVAGDEIAVVSSSGAIYVLSRDADQWDCRPVAKTAGELIAVDIGDVDLTRPGNEILAVGTKDGTEDDGGPGMAWLVTDVDSEDPILVPLLQDSDLLHSACIAEIDPVHPGAEIVVAGFSGSVHVISHDGVGFVERPACSLDGAAKQIVPWRGGVAIACDNGDLVFLELREGVWQKSTLAHADAPLARLDASKDRIAIARDDGALWLFDPATPGEDQVVYQEQHKLRGAAIADLEPDRPGLELASVGYEGRIVILAEDKDGDWQSVEVWQDEQALHHLAHGEADPAGIGSELVACGYSGQIILVRRTKVVH